MASKEITETGVRDVLETMGIPAFFQGLQEGITGLQDEAVGRLETAATIGSGVAGTMAGMGGGMFEMLRSGNPQAALDQYRQIQDAMTFIPRSEKGLENIQQIGEFLEPVSQLYEQYGQGVSELTGSPVVGEFAQEFVDPGDILGYGAIASIPAIAKATKKARPGTPFAKPEVNLDLGVPEEELDAIADRFIKAYHGSPYDFEKFMLEYIGQGEGAQAYGWGLYFAQLQEVAERYKQAPEVLEGFDNFAMSDAANKYVMDINKNTDNGLIEYATDELLAGDFTPDTIKRKMQELDDDFTQQEIDAAIGEFDGILKDLDTKFSGTMYEVNIKAKPEELLNWDKPLSQQSDVIKKNLLKLGEENPELFTKDQMRILQGNPNKAFGTIWGDAKGQHIYDTLSEYFNRYPGTDFGDPKSPEAASKALESIGIKGITYADQLTRAGEGGTSNFVIFDPRIIKIAKKYGVAVPVAGMILMQIEKELEKQTEQAPVA